VSSNRQTVQFNAHIVSVWPHKGRASLSFLRTACGYGSSQLLGHFTNIWIHLVQLIHSASRSGIKHQADMSLTAVFIHQLAVISLHRLAQGRTPHQARSNYTRPQVYELL